jgi:hypothetical protein
MDGMMEKLNTIEGKYVTNQTFADTIKNSGSKAAINRLEVELYMKELSQSRDRGCGVDM